jgi:hypothetical protein
MGGPALFLVAALLGHGAPPCPEISKPDLRVELPGLGGVDVWGIVRPNGQTIIEARAVLCRWHRLLRQYDLSDLDPPVIYSSLLRPPGWPSPVLSVVAPWMGGDGGRREAILLNVADGHLVEPLGRLHLDGNDAICLGDRAPAADIAATIVQFVPRDDCARCRPTRFRATVYSWQNGQLVPTERIATRRRYADWHSALRELAVPCPIEAISTTLSQGH